MLEELVIVLSLALNIGYLAEVTFKWSYHVFTELYYYLRILDTVLSLIIMCNLLPFNHFPEDDKQYINRKWGKIFSTILFSSRNFLKTETYMYILFVCISILYAILTSTKYRYCIFNKKWNKKWNFLSNKSIAVLRNGPLTCKSRAFIYWNLFQSQLLLMFLVKKVNFCQYIRYLLPLSFQTYIYIWYIQYDYIW